MRGIIYINKKTDYDMDNCFISFSIVYIFLVVSSDKKMDFIRLC